MDRRLWEDLELPALPIVALQLVTADRELVKIIYFLAIKSLRWLISLEHVDKAPNWQVQSMGCFFNLGRAGGGGAEAQQIDGPISPLLSHRSRLLVGMATVHGDRPPLTRLPSEGRTVNGFIAALINEVITKSWFLFLFNPQLLTSKCLIKPIYSNYTHCLLLFPTPPPQTFCCRLTQQKVY